MNHRLLSLLFLFQGVPISLVSKGVASLALGYGEMRGSASMIEQL